MSLLSTIGSMVGMVFGGPGGAALGSGLGSLLGGGSLSDAFKSGIGTLMTGGLGGKAGIVADLLGGGASSRGAGEALFGAFGGGGGGGQNFLEALVPGLGGTKASSSAATSQTRAPAKGGLQGLLSAFDNPLMMAAILKATEPKNVSVTTPEQRRQLETGERLPDYQGTPAFDYRYARGGMVEGPGTGTSDSIRARIYQNGRPVEEARLSDGEFVMTNRAVRGAGNGDRARGAAEMYRMMNKLERRA